MYSLLSELIRARNSLYAPIVVHQDILPRKHCPDQCGFSNSTKLSLNNPGYGLSKNLLTDLDNLDLYICFSTHADSIKFIEHSISQGSEGSTGHFADVSVGQ